MKTQCKQCSHKITQPPRKEAKKDDILKKNYARYGGNQTLYR